MLYFVACYAAVLLVSFAGFVIIFQDKRKNRRRVKSAEKIINEDMLIYSLSNPMIPQNNKSLHSERMFVELTIKSEGKKQSTVYDAAKTVCIGASGNNKIISTGTNTANCNIVLYLKKNKVCIYNNSKSCNYIFKRGLNKNKINPGRNIYIRDKDILFAGNIKIKIGLFPFSSINR